MLVDEPPPLGPYGVPEPIATLVARCLASDPADRFADAGEVRDALLALRLDRSAAARARPPDATIDSAVTRFATSASSTSALAHSRDPLLGRERETSELVALLDGGARFVTITGLGGIGKSRLAAEVARRLHARDRRRVLHVSLGAVRAVRDALAALAATLGADLAAAHDDDEATSTALALSLRSHGRVLLLVDDAEGVARGLAEWLVRALAAAPEALLLVTSRERLGVDMERAYPLGPLDADSGAELFLERARAARPTLGRDAATRDVARDIAHRLEGSPLAIELAAARASLLAPEAIRDRLDDRLRLLTSRASGGSSRHSSLRAVLEWSWSLLDENERAALGQMAAFRDPAPVEAAEAIVSLPDAYALDVLTALRDKSLLRVDDRPDGVTFVMDESVRLYAEEAIRRAPEAWNAACARHAAHFGRSAADAVALSDLGLDGRGDAWLADHHRDLFAAADRALAAEGATLDDGAACVAALGRARTQHGVAARDRVAAFVERTSALRPEVAADLLVAHARLEESSGASAPSTPPSAPSTLPGAPATRRASRAPWRSKVRRSSRRASSRGPPRSARPPSSTRGASATRASRESLGASWPTRSRASAPMPGARFSHPRSRAPTLAVPIACSPSSSSSRRDSSAAPANTSAPWPQRPKRSSARASSGSSVSRRSRT